MRLPRVALAIIGIVAMLLGPASEALAGGGAVARCETANPSGPPISLTITALDVDTTNEVVNSISVLVQFGGRTFGTFSATNVDFFGAVNNIDAGCLVFNDNSDLGARILAAVGLPATFQFNFTACSFQGPSSGDCVAPLGTVNTPVGFPTQITAYAGR